MPEEVYRYISENEEIEQIVRERRVQSTNAVTEYLTWFTPRRYETPAAAQEELALPHEPTHRVGPIASNLMPALEIEVRSVDPAFGQPGGGLEVATRNPIWLFGLWDFTTSGWEL